jgi:hypothetical protein
LNTSTQRGDSTDREIGGLKRSGAAGDGNRLSGAASFCALDSRNNAAVRKPVAIDGSGVNIESTGVTASRAITAYAIESDVVSGRRARSACVHAPDVITDVSGDTRSWYSKTHGANAARSRVAHVLRRTYSGNTGVRPGV